MSDTENMSANPAQAAGLVGGHVALGLIASLGAAVVFSSMWRDVKDNSRETTTLDKDVATWMKAHQRPGWTDAARCLAFAGSPPVMVSLGMGAACLGLLDRKLRGAAWTFPSAILGAGAIIQGIKVVFRRPRPNFFKPLLHETGFSFPSGHTVIGVTVYGLLGYFGQGKLQKRSAKDALMIGCGSLAVLAGVSRVYVGVHYVSDVLAGWSAGLPWLLTCIGLHESLARRTAMPGEPLLPGSEANPLEALVMGNKTRPDA